VNSGAGIYKVGQPYQINGQWYYPREDYSYDETGIASWYGADFHNQSTSNGEIFNKNELTAAHKTLPLPSLARVTNLDNGRSIVVRINDRGPFSGSRIIDMSQRAAQLLGFEAQGTAKVRVQVLADESKAIADAMRHYAKPTELAEANPQAGAPVTTISEQPLQITSAPVESETLQPIRSTPETHRELLKTQPVPEVVQWPVTGTHNIFVQAGAFTVSDNAARLQQNMSSLSPTTVSTIVINGTKFYRVRLGPVSDVAHADALLSRVKQAGIAGARTVVD
jgi:rare lipoprotein A